MSGAALNGFPLRRISDVCDVVNGGTPKTGEPKFWDGPHQWITPAEMGKRQSPYVESTERTLTGVGLEELAGKLVPAKSVILSSRAPIGHLVINTVPMAFNQGCKGLVPQKGLHYKFLYYYLYSIREELYAMGTGATFPELSSGRLKDVRVPLPPSAEQQRIVGILDEAFAGIATAKANAEKNLRNACELFDCILEALFNVRDEQWQDKRLGDLCERVSVGHVGETSEFYTDSENGVPFLRSQNVRPMRIDLDGLRYITPAFHARLKKSQLRGGDLLFVRVGANRGDCCSIPDESIGDMNCANIVFARPRDGVTRFLECYCNSISGRRALLGMTTGAAQGVINTKSVAELVVPLPPATAQQRILGLLSVLRAKTQRLESLYQQKLAALDALKKSLLHQAFNGQL